MSDILAVAIAGEHLAPNCAWVSGTRKRHVQIALPKVSASP
jgi:hypothetical protein